MRISDWSSDVCSSDLPFARAGGVVQQDQSANDDLVKQHFGGAANMGVHGPGRAIDDQHAYGTGKGGKLIPIAAPIARSGAKGRVVHMGRQIMIGQPFLGSDDAVAKIGRAAWRERGW